MASLDSSALHTFFEKSRSGMAILGRDMHFLNVNPALCLILGYAEDELEGKDWAVVSDSVDWDVWERLKSGDLHEASFNQRFINRSHAVVELHLVITAIPDGETMPSRFAVLAEDVTHDLEDDSSFHYLFDNMLNGLAYCRMLFENGEPLDFIYLRVNSAFEMQTGLKHVVGHKVSEVIPGIRETDPGLLQAYGRVAMTGQPERFEVFLDALQMWFHVSVYSPKPEHFVAVFDVITDRKNTENHLRLISEAFAHADEGILIVDRQGNIVEANPACSRITGYSREEILGKNPRIFQSGRQDDAFYAAMWGEILSQGHWTGEIWNRRKNGEVYPEKLVISVIKDGADERLTISGSFRTFPPSRNSSASSNCWPITIPLPGCRIAPCSMTGFPCPWHRQGVPAGRWRCASWISTASSRSMTALAIGWGICCLSKWRTGLQRRCGQPILWLGSVGTNSS